MLKPRAVGRGGGEDGKGNDDGPLSASAVASVAALLAAASSSSSIAPAPAVVSRSVAWRNPAARARLSAGRARFRAASAALSVAAASVGTGVEVEVEGEEVFRSRALASFSGTPVDFEIAFRGKGGIVERPMALFVGLPGDFPPSSPKSRSSPTLTSVVKRLRRSGVPAAVFPFWEFDAAAEEGKLAEAMLEAARGALERE